MAGECASFYFIVVPVYNNFEFFFVIDSEVKMLKGFVEYRDSSDKVHRFEVIGHAGFKGLKLYFPLCTDELRFQRYIGAEGQYVVPANEYEQQILENLVFLDGVSDESPDKESFLDYEGHRNWANRRLDILEGNKYKTNIQNVDFASKVTALVRWGVLQPQKKSEEVVTKFGENIVSRILDSKRQNLGSITYREGIITALQLENKFVRIILEEYLANTNVTSIFGELKEKDNWGNIVSPMPIHIQGIKMHTDLLGFEYVPEVKQEMPKSFGMYETLEEVIRAHPNKDTHWMLEQNFTIVTDEDLEKVMKIIWAYPGRLKLDTETTGLNITHKSRVGMGDVLVGLGITLGRDANFYFPLQHKLFKNLCGGDHTYFMQHYMKELLETKESVIHNVQFDWKVFYIYDILVNCVYDTMLAIQVTKGYEVPNFPYGLKSIVKLWLGLDMFSLNDFVIGGNYSESDIKFWDLPYEIVKRYGPADTYCLCLLYEYIEENKILAKYNAKKILDLEVRFAKAVAYAEFYGYHIDVANIPALQSEILEAMEHNKLKMFEIVGREFNPSSPIQLSKIMYEELGIEKIDNSVKTDKKVLKALSKLKDEEGNSRYPFVTYLKEYRDNEGIYKNFLKKLGTFCSVDGYIHSSVQPVKATTGRVAVKDPNYQSYNDIVKKYVTPRQGYISVDCDFAQIEYRVLCSLAKQENLIEAFLDPDLDYHTKQASRMHGIPYALVSPKLRQECKGINFGLPFGMGDASLGAAVFGVKNKENTKKAGILRKKFFEGQERIEDFFQRTRDGGVKEGYTSTHFGRRRYYQRGVVDEAGIRRQAGNHVIQGSAADIYKIAVIQLFERVIREGWLGLVIFNTFVHDELLMEVHNSIDMYYFTKVWKEEFEVEIPGFTKLYAGLGYGKCWYDAKKLDLPVQFIEEIVAKAEEPGRQWHGDLDKFLHEVKEAYVEHKTRRVIEYITAKESQGEIIKPVIGGLLTKEVNTILAEVVKTPELYREYLKEVIEGDGVEEEKGVCKVEKLASQLRIFCKYHNIDSSNLNIIAPEDAVVEQSGELIGGDCEVSESDIVVPSSLELLSLSLTLQGVAIDNDTQTVYVKEMILPPTYAENGILYGGYPVTALLQQKEVLVPVSDCPTGYRIMFIEKGGIENAVEIATFRVSEYMITVLMQWYYIWKQQWGAKFKE